MSCSEGIGTSRRWMLFASPGRTATAFMVDRRASRAPSVPGAESLDVVLMGVPSRCDRRARLCTRHVQPRTAAEQEAPAAVLGGTFGELKAPVSLSARLSGAGERGRCALQRIAAGA